MKILFVASQTTGFKRIGSEVFDKPFPGCEHREIFTDPYWECLARHYTEYIYHYAGTAKMGPFWDSDAVVDPELRSVPDTVLLEE